MQNVSLQDLSLTVLWRRSLLYGNQSFDLQSKSIDWFLYIVASIMKDLKTHTQA